MLPIINGVGTLTKDPEILYTQSGTAITKITLAFNNRYKTKSGEQKEETCFLDAVVYGALGEKVVNAFLRKGSKTFFSGKLKQESWTNQAGEKRTKHIIQIEDVALIDSRNNTKPNQPQQQYQPQQRPAPTVEYQNQQGQPYQPRQQQRPAQPQQLDIDDENVPF